MHIGIDPGIKGAIAGVHDDGSLAIAWDIPTRMVRGKAAVDEDKLVDSLKDLSRHGIQSLMIEKPFYKPSDRGNVPGEYAIPIKSQMVARVNSGVLYGMAKMIFRDVKLVEPAIWKRAIGIPKGSDKHVSIDMASKLFGNDPRVCRDGRAEAAMIAYYGMRCHKLEKTHETEPQAVRRERSR